MRHFERTNTVEREPYFPSKRPLQRELGGPGLYMPQIAVMQRINGFVVLECDVRAKAKLRKCVVVSQKPLATRLWLRSAPNGRNRMDDARPSR